MLPGVYSNIGSIVLFVCWQATVVALVARALSVAEVERG
jgi:hypothetical protein